MTDQSTTHPPEKSKAVPSEKNKHVLRRIGTIAGALLGMLIITVLVVMIFHIPIELHWIKGKVETAAAEALGRDVSIDGALILVPSLPLAARVEKVRVGNPKAWPAADLVRLDLARVQLKVLPLLRGEVQIDEITVQGLRVNLETNVQGEPNWLLAGADALEAPSESKEDQPNGPAALRFIELAELSLRNIVVRHHNAGNGKNIELVLDEITGSAKDHESMDLLIQGKLQQVPYNVTVNSGSLATLVARKDPWPIDFYAAMAGIKLAVTGEIADPLRGKGLNLLFDLTGEKMRDLEVLLNMDLPAVKAFAVKGRIEEKGGKYRIVDLKGDMAAANLSGSFEADTSREKPKLTGSLAIRSIDVGPFFAAIEAGGEAQSKVPQAGIDGSGKQQDKKAGAGPAVGIDLDEPIFVLDALSLFDAKFDLIIHEVVNGPTTLREASLSASIADGKLSAPVAVTLAEVPFKGKINLGSENDKPEVEISLTGEQSAIGDLAAWLSGTEGIEGKFDFVRLDFTAGGETIRSLVKTSAMKFDLEGAALSYGHDVAGGRPIDFTLEKADLRFPAADESTVSFKGTLLGEPFALMFSGGTFIENIVQKRWPLSLKASGSGAQLTVNGTIRQPERDAGSEIDFALTGAKIGDLSTWLGVDPGTGYPYALTGKITHTQAGVRIRLNEARVGKSVFSGTLGQRIEAETALIFAELDFTFLNLKETDSFFSENMESKTSDPAASTGGPDALTLDIPILPQEIELFDSDLDIMAAHILTDPIDFTNLSFSARIRDSHVEKAPLAVELAGTRFDGNLGLDFRGRIPKVDFRLRSGRADVGALLAQLGVVEGLAMTAGGLDLDLALEGASLREIVQRSRLAAEVTDGTWKFQAPGAKEGIDIIVPTVTLTAAPDQPLQLAMDGRIRRTPLKIDITTDLKSISEKKDRLDVAVAAALAGARLELTGAAPMPLRGDNLRFSMDFHGNRFSDFNELFNVSLPPFGPYRLKGDFGTRSSGYFVENLKVTVGESALAGKLNFQTDHRPSRLDIDLAAPQIQLDDFDTGEWSATGEKKSKTEAIKSSKASAATIPAVDRNRAILSPEVLKRLNARIDLQVDDVISGRDHIGRGKLTAMLENGRITVDPLFVDIPGGAVDVGFTLQPTEDEVILEADAKVEKLDYGILARRIDPDAATGGLISVDLDLKTRGPDFKGVMEEADGYMDFGIWPEDLNAGLFDLWAVNVLTALMKEVDKEDASKVNCVTVSFQVDDGLMRERVVYADTSKMQVQGSAEINFKTHTLDIQAAPKAKRPEFFSLSVPVGVKGTFDDFGIKIKPVSVTGKAVSFVTSPLHVPIRRLFKKGIPEDGEQACSEAWNRRKTALEDAPAQ